MSLRTLCLIVWVSAGVPAAASAPLTLAEGGRSPYRIVIAREASPSERRAAEELQRFLEQISGVRLPVVTDEAAPRGPLVLVGDSRALRRLRVSIPFEHLGPEGFALKTAGRNLIIAGGRQRGTMYGVYAFLEKLGCRWFTAEVSRIPKLPAVRVPALDELQKPAFEYREPFFTEAFDKDWAARNRVNGHFSKLDESTGGKIQYYPFVHSFYTLLPPEKYFREHPEYYSLIAGRRRHERAQLCLTHPEVLRLATETVLEWIRQHPEATIFSVSQNDWTGWCECDNCRRVEQEEGGVHSGPLLRFVNALATEIEKRHPDKLIDTLAYWYTEAPPARVRPRPNVRIRLCPISVCEAHPYERCDRNAWFLKNLKAWAAVTRQLYIWHYNTNFRHYLMPFPDFDELAADIPMYHRYGVVGLFLEGAYAPGGGGEMAELRSYLMARLLWDVKADPRQAVEEFLEGVYGRAAPRIREYLDLLHRQVRLPPEGRGHHIWIFQNPGAPYLDGEFLARARELLERGEAKADNEAIRRRVRKVRLSIDYVELIRSMAFQIHDGWYAATRPEDLRERFGRFLAEVRSFGIQQLHEGRGLEFDEKELPDRLSRYGVFTLENEALRVELAPGLDGRIIRLVCKADGKDRLRPTDPGESGYPNVGGLAAFVHPDFQGRAWQVAWRVENAAPDRLMLAGACANGLKLRRTIRLVGPEVRTETEVENAASAPIQATLRSRVEFGLAPEEDVRLAVFYRTQDGRTVDRTLFEPGLSTSGADALEGPARPAGAWRAFDRRSRLGLLNRFPADQAARAVVEWSVRGENRIALTLWSSERELKPGERLTLEAAYAPE
ncbi:MAG: DUF4838 domain-containing protein [Bryobacteraceae bacterium]|nr:DUF4838 domain-containing protein [Bryobacteraceae bacterium]